MQENEKKHHSLVIVDDEEAILFALKSLFRKDPWSVRTHNSARRAIEDLQTSPADIVISDLRMPEMNGIEFLNHISSTCPESVRFILSGHEDHGVVVNALARNLAQHYVLKPWDSADLRRLLQETLRIQADVKSKRIEQLMATFERLPNLSQQDTRLRELLNKTNYPLNDIVAEIHKSPALVARLLRVANSIYYATRRPVLTVRDAVLFIGTDYISSLLIAMETIHLVLSAGEAVPEHLIELVWNMALQRAVTAQMLAKGGLCKADPPLVYVVALLQDIGLMVRLCSDPVRFARVIELDRAGMLSLYEADAAVYGPPHDALGAALLESWSLPKEIVVAVRDHHATSSTSDIVQLVQLADILSTSGKPNPHDPNIERHLDQARRIISNVTTDTPP